MTGGTYLKDGMRDIYFFKFHAKMRFPIFPTVRLYSPYWTSNSLKEWFVSIGNWREPERADTIGKALLLASDKYLFGNLPTKFLEYDTGLKYLDAEELFAQMHKTKWEGNATEVVLNIFHWLDRGKSFYKYLKIWQEQKKRENAERRHNQRTIKSKKQRRSKQHDRK